MTSKMLGPFLCRPSETSMGFWVAFGPGHAPLVSLTVDVMSSGEGLVETVLLRPVVGRYSVYTADTSKALNPDSQYTYQLKLEGVVLPVPGLEPSDFTFRTLPGKVQEIEFLLMSCHGVEAYEEHYHDKPEIKAKVWDMWNELADTLKERPNCRFGILAGDQVYMDTTFKEDISNFDQYDSGQTERMIYDAYFKYWEKPSYRKVMARLPCMLMWDDHDIIDGWGSREEQRGSQADKWKAYGKHLFGAFEEMQAVRNPTRVDGPSGYSFVFKWQHVLVAALDLRGTRSLGADGVPPGMLSAANKEKIEQAVAGLADKVTTLFFVSPVTIARMGGPIERGLGSLTNFTWNAIPWAYKLGNKWRAFIWATLFSILFTVLHLDTQEAPGFFQSVTVFVASALLLSRLRRLKRYFVHHAKKVRLALAFFMFWSAGAITYELLTQPKDLNGGLPARLGVIFTSGLIESWVETIATLSVGAAGIILFSGFKGTSLLYRVGNKLSKLAPYLLLLVLLFSIWRGFPGKVSLLLPVYLGLCFCIYFSFLVAVLERAGAVDMIASLDDDLRDGWSYEGNSGDLKWLVDQFFAAFKSGVRHVSFLSGDIHTGGVSEIKLMGQRPERVVNQITSSPMSYYTMPAIVEKLTSGAGVVPMYHKDEKSHLKSLICEARNLFYRCHRNYVFVKVGQAGEIGAQFHFEDLEKPISISLL